MVSVSPLIVEIVERKRRCYAVHLCTTIVVDLANAMRNSMARTTTRQPASSWLVELWDMLMLCLDFTQRIARE